MSMTLLLDTNVWVDNYCANHVACRAVRAMLDEAYQQGAVLVYPAGIVKDVFYVLGHEFRRAALANSGSNSLSESEALAVRQAVWGCVDNMCEVATAVGMDEADVWKARKYRSVTGDLEDNMVLAAAERVHANYIVTSDQDLIQHSTVAALTPTDMLSVLIAK